MAVCWKCIASENVTLMETLIRCLAELYVHRTRGADLCADCLLKLVYNIGPYAGGKADQQDARQYLQQISHI